MFYFSILVNWNSYFNKFQFLSEKAQEAIAHSNDVAEEVLEF